MAKKDEPQGIQCENIDIELLRRQLARLETMITDKFSEVRELIENAPAQQPVFPPPAEPTEPLPVEVNLPDNLARSEDISNMAGIIQTLNGTVSLVMQGLAELQTLFKAMPKQDVDAIVQSAATTAVNRLGNEYLGKISEKIDSGLNKSYINGQAKATAIGYDDASAINSRLGRIEDSIAMRDKTAYKNKVIRILSFCIVGMVRMLLSINSCSPQYFFVILQNDNYKQSEYGRNGLDPQAAMPPNQSNSKTPKQSLQARPALR